MGDIEERWKIFRRNYLPPELKQDGLAAYKLAFFAGALNYFQVFNEAAKMENNLAEMTVRALDSEIKRFEELFSMVKKVEQPLTAEGGEPKKIVPP